MRRKKEKNPELENSVDYWKKKYKKLNTEFIVVAVLMIMLLTSTLGMYAYAKYITNNK